MFEDTEGVIRSSKSKDRQYNDQNKKGKQYNDQNKKGKQYNDQNKNGKQMICKILHRNLKIEQNNLH